MLGRDSNGKRTNGHGRRAGAVPQVGTILVADADTMFRVGLSELLGGLFPGARIVEAADAQQLAAALRAAAFDLVLLDLVLPGVKGYLWLAELRQQHPGPIWIAVSGIDTPIVRQRALALGLARVVSKRASSAALSAAVLSTVRGWRRAPRLPPREQRLIDGLTRLTRAELRLLATLPDNPSHRHIMRTLGVALPTVKTHMSRILAKLGLRNRTEAAVVASKLSHVESRSLCIDHVPATRDAD